MVLDSSIETETDYDVSSSILVAGFELLLLVLSDTEYSPDLQPTLLKRDIFLMEPDSAILLKLSIHIMESLNLDYFY